jgi:MFS family permease
MKSLVLPVYLPTALFGIGEGAIIPVIPASAESLGANLPTAGLIAGALMIGTVLADLPAARIVNRVGERTSMIWASFIAAIGILFSLYATNIYMLGFGVFAMGASAAIYGLARHAYIAETVPTTHRARAMAMLGGTFRIGTFGGPLLGASVISMFGLSSAYVVPVILCSLAGGLLIFTTKPGIMTITNDAPVGNTWFIAKREYKKLITLGAASTILQMSRTARTIGLPLWALSMKLEPAQSALFIGIAGSIDFALFYTSGQIMDRFGRRWVAMPSLAAMGVCLLLLATVKDANGFLIAAIALALANGIGSGVVLVIGADLAPADARNEFLSAYRFMFDSGIALTAPIISTLAVVFSLAVGISTMGALSLVGAFLFWRYLPKFKIK